ncbi:hypothetical protein VN97_g11878 [Penicillium thymicola]|uniref:Uncharacterized protein n=1 Tax=Penicillium thymicola TaxID=293382 RepID=A0AAI9T700_PENTH|nr:hypothetical protein VN97_g11878 [Penicillium thymicola]
MRTSILSPRFIVGSSDVDPTGQSTIVRCIVPIESMQVQTHASIPPALHPRLLVPKPALMKWGTHGRFAPIAPACPVPRLSPFLPFPFLFDILLILILTLLVVTLARAIPFPVLIGMNDRRSMAIF